MQTAAAFAGDLCWRPSEGWIQGPHSQVLGCSRPANDSGRAGALASRLHAQLHCGDPCMSLPILDISNDSMTVLAIQVDPAQFERWLSQYAI